MVTFVPLYSSNNIITLKVVAGAAETCCEKVVNFVAYLYIMHCATSRAVPGSNPGGVGHRDFSRGYRQNHVPWGQLSL